MDKEIKPRIWSIWLMFFIFCLLFTLNNMLSEDNATSFAWLLLEVWVLILDIIILIKHKLPSRKYACISLALGFAVAATYLDVMIVTKSMSRIFSLIVAPVLTFLSGVVVFRIIETYPKDMLRMIYKKNLRSVLFSVIIGITFGIVWGVLNYLLMLGNSQSNLYITVHCFLVSLSPAILEELAMRAVFYAFCISLLHGNVTTKSQKFTCWVMMIVPQVLVHTPNAFIKGGIVSGLVSTVLYIVVFGLIFAILQKKRDVISAMVAHGTVDFIRFCFFGLPF